MVGEHSVRRRGRFISPVYVFGCFVVDYSLCSCMFVGVSWLVIRCVRVCLCRLVADLFAICGIWRCVCTIVRTYLFSVSIMSVQRCYTQ